LAPIIIIVLHLFWLGSPTVPGNASRCSREIKTGQGNIFTLPMASGAEGWRFLF